MSNGHTPISTGNGRATDATDTATVCPGQSNGHDQRTLHPAGATDTISPSIQGEMSCPMADRRVER